MSNNTNKKVSELTLGGKALSALGLFFKTSTVSGGVIAGASLIAAFAISGEIGFFMMSGLLGGIFIAALSAVGLVCVIFNNYNNKIVSTKAQDNGNEETMRCVTGIQYSTF